MLLEGTNRLYMARHVFAVSCPRIWRGTAVFLFLHCFFMERIHARQATCRGSKALLFVKAYHVCDGVWYFGTGA